MNQFYTPRMTPTNKGIIIGMLAIFLANSVASKFFDHSLLSWLALHPGDFLRGHIYQLLTYPWIQTGLFSFLFDVLLLWFLGSELEGYWGRKVYLGFLASAAVGGGFIYLALAPLFTIGMPLFGPMGLTLALCLGYALVYRERYLTFMFLFPMKAMHFCLLLIGIQLYLALFGQGIVAVAHLGAMAGGYSYLRLKSWSVRRKGRVKSSISGRKGGGHLHLVSKDETDSTDERGQGGPKYWQ